MEEGFKEALLTEWGYNILTLLEKEMTFEKLLAELQSYFSSDISAEKEGIYRSVLVELEHLFTTVSFM
ncbi:hypothetical protein [Bacteroides faecichinchillae]|uniref:hypothetical protein n=1 Tax=Bacteroides faecichinchillae TaxID=871325 RepID=UPI000AC5B7AA|nr:hypothetical protein [Bacteroides faecichinchillae]